MTTTSVEQNICITLRPKSLPSLTMTALLYLPLNLTAAHSEDFCYAADLVASWSDLGFRTCVSLPVICHFSSEVNCVVS